MNKREKEFLQAQLDKEKAVLEELKKQYARSLRDIEQKTKVLMFDIQQLDEALNTDGLDDRSKEVFESRKQSKIYQKQHQEALKKQVEAITEKLHSDEYSTIERYLKECYTDAYVGTMYDISGQGIPVITPIDQTAVVRAVMTDSKISEGLYTALGVDTKALKIAISAEISRGIATGQSYAQIAKNLNGVANTKYSNAMRIVRTEGHRIQNASAYDAQQAAKAKGCNVVKQWDSTLDGKTRPTHRELDGQIREVEEYFEAAGKKAKYPGDFGDPAEDCNCRCTTLTRARWALGEEELKTLQDRARFFGLDKTESFEDYKKKYLKAAKVETTSSKFVPAKDKATAEKYAYDAGVKYVDYSKLPLETANQLNAALNTLPKDIKPVFVGDSTTLEKYWGGKLPRSSKHYYGVTIDVFDGIHLGFDESAGKNVIDFDTTGYMVGISSSYKTADKITAAKKLAQERYQERHKGHTWFFNVSGETTPYHEMGHVYVNVKGLPSGFEGAAVKWASESKCDMLSNATEAWAEAWAAYHTGSNALPDYIEKFIEDATKK